MYYTKSPSSCERGDIFGELGDELGKKFAAMPEEDRPDAVVFAILTDGLENASTRFSLPDGHGRRRPRVLRGRPRAHPPRPHLPPPPGVTAVALKRDPPAPPGGRGVLDAPSP